MGHLLCVGCPSVDTGCRDPIWALVAQHAFDDDTRLTRGDGPLMALAAQDERGPLSPSESPMGLG